MKRVAVIGSQGVPAKYGGFETLVENIIGRHCGKDVEYTVFCSAKDMDSSLSSYKGASLRYIPLRAHGLQSVPYDIMSMMDACQGYDTILILGTSGAIFLPFLKLFTFKRKRIIVNIDGLEHERPKWTPTIKRFLRFCLASCIRWADEIVSDNKGIQDYVREHYGREARLIAYGGDHAIRNINNRRQQAILDFYGLKKDEYALSICRIEPENNCDLTLETFRESGRPLVFIGNWDNSDYSKELFRKYKGVKGFKLLNAIYDLDILFAIRNNCRLYVHGHRAGGTNPSLVEMMFFGKPILAFDVVYNRCTTQDTAYYFKDREQLAQLISRTDLDGSRSRQIANAQYIWRDIARQYEALY